MTDAYQSLMSTSSTRTMLFHQAVADVLGLHPTDHKCVLFLLDGPKTAGQIAELTGLTTGATTTVIDRLEAAGYVTRQADSQDRRRVYVHIVPAKVETIAALFAPLERAVAELDAGYSQRDQQLIQEYDRKIADILHQQTVRLKELPRR